MEVKDTGTILKIALAVISLFGFNDMQKNEINNYVKNNMYTWISQRKNEDEIETMIKIEASRISR